MFITDYTVISFGRSSLNNFCVLPDSGRWQFMNERSMPFLHDYNKQFRCVHQHVNEVLLYTSVVCLQITLQSECNDYYCLMQ